MNKRISQITAAVLVGLASSSANAFFLYPGLTQLEDDNREYLVKGAGNTDPTMAGIIQVGDSLRGVVKFQSILQIDAPFGSQSPILPELTGIFQTEVKSITATTPGFGNIVWGPSSAFTSVYGAGSMVALYTGGTTLDLNACPSIAACESAATDGGGGLSWLTAGFADADDQWSSINSNLNFGLVSTLGATTKVATINYALSLLTNNTGYLFNEVALDCGIGIFACAGDGKTDFVGSGDALGGRGLTNGYGARSDIDVLMNVVPEPGALALLGLGLAGLGFSRRQKQS